MTNNQPLPGSFRDPSGFLFFRDGSLYRQVNQTYREDYDLLLKSELYRKLADNRLLVSHREVDIPPADPTRVYKIIQPEVMPFISYPYEWCFSQLKDAALLTLEIERVALDCGMTLKDASAYNIQFKDGKPIFIDTLSFTRYIEGEPWTAYRQFCQHFLAPLALMRYSDIRLSGLLRNYIDGIPLDLAAALLPWRTKATFSLLSHIHLHAKSQQHYAERTTKPTRGRMSLLARRGLVENLTTVVRRLQWNPRGTEWADYYGDTNYSATALEHKKQLVIEFLAASEPKSVWDLGGNVGMYSRLAADRGIMTLSFDLDPGAVEKNYRECVTEGRTNLLPLVIDLTNPSPGIGWGGTERMSFFERAPADTVMALALVHHLAISNNVPLSDIARLFHQLGAWLIVEFVPKDDSQVRRLLVTREDIFVDYTREKFEESFAHCYTIERAEPIADSKRTLYLMRARRDE